MNIRFALLGSSTIVCNPRPPAPGAHWDPDPCSRSPFSSFQFWPPSVDWNSAASSTPA